MAKAKPAPETEQKAIVLQSGLSIEDLAVELGPFMQSVDAQLDSEDPAMQETATLFSRELVGAMLEKGDILTHSGSKQANPLAVRDRVAELYFAFLDLAARIRRGVQQAELMARRQERFAEIIRSNIEAWMLTSWNAKKITGNYREFRISKNPDKVMVIDEAQIPAEYFDDVPATKVLNKTRLAEALKAREVVKQEVIKDEKLTPEEREQSLKQIAIPGAILETSRTRLDIK
jgi:hypothetical protein